MTTPKHTPGPWGAQWSKYRDGEFIVQAGHPTYRVLARFDGDGVSDVPDEQSIANAHLIAAAPELYEVGIRALSSLNSVLRHRNAIVNFGCIEYERDMLLDALAKARGEG